MLGRASGTRHIAIRMNPGDPSMFSRVSGLVLARCLAADHGAAILWAEGVIGFPAALIPRAFPSGCQSQGASALGPGAADHAPFREAASQRELRGPHYTVGVGQGPHGRPSGTIWRPTFGSRAVARVRDRMLSATGKFC